MQGKTLLLMRHAKSSWDAPDLADVERPLNARGHRAAPAMAPFVAAWHPQWIGCSIAQRTRTTLLPIVDQLATPAHIDLTDSLYDSSQAAYLRYIQGLDGAISRALILGHNPMLEELCATLVVGAQPGMLERLAQKLPTGTLVVLECSIVDWSDLAPRCAHLIDVIRPSDLPETA